MTRRNHGHRVIPAMAEAREQNAAIDQVMADIWSGPSLDAQIAEARAIMGETRWAELNAEWVK